MLKVLFKLYLKNLERLGGFYNWLTTKTASWLQTPRPETVGGKEAPGDVPPRALDDLDQQATVLGDTYRGIGVLAGLLTVGIVFFSTLPSALHMPQSLHKASEILQVACMAAIVFLLFYSRRSGMKERWIALRVAAEPMRYTALSLALAQAKVSHSGIDASTLRNACLAVIEGENGQLVYHMKRARQFDAILRGSRLFTLLSIALSLVAAAIQLFLPLQWLLFLIAFLPGMAGALQGVNGFLRLGGLLNEHQIMAQRLSSLRDRLMDAGDATAALSVAEKIYDTLIGESKVWGDIAGVNFDL